MARRSYGQLDDRPRVEAERRLGSKAAAKARHRGLEVDAGYRVTRACELARSRPPLERNPEPDAAAGRAGTLDSPAPSVPRRQILKLSLSG
jgi:hypothetical protein